jgi:hypothetical protein
MLLNLSMQDHVQFYLERAELLTYQNRYHLTEKELRLVLSRSIH